MRTKTFFNYVVAALFCCCVTGMVTSCLSLMDTGSADNPSAENMIKQGVWTEHDTAFVASGKYTEEELEEMPAVGMMVEGDRAYFFTYSAEGADNLVEGKISYYKDAGTGVIAFPAIKDSPVSGQTVSFKMVSDELMDFEFTYEGEKVTGSCAWLCRDLSNWGTESDDAEWKELMAYYDAISAEGPDASIDWSGSATVTVQDVDDEGNPVEKEVTVTDLDKPLEWNEDIAATRAGTRAIGIGTVVSMGLKVLGSLFEEDPNEAINAKLDAVLGKLDQVLTNQQQMMAKVNEMNGRLIAIAQKMKKTETVNILNNRNEKFYNPLKVCNTAYFDAAFKLYNDNKSDLSQVKTQLGNYAKTWVGNNEEYITLTWNYIEYLKTVQHSSYGIGMDRIYDGLTFDKYPWEHLGTGDRLNYRAYDMFMITKCLFMINLYAAYGSGLSDIKKEGIYNNYNSYKPQLKQFCEFTVANPDEFRVCQIPGAHFVMHKELQKYNYKSCVPLKYGEEGAYRPEFHEAGSIKIENPKELKSKLILEDAAKAIFNYYKSAFYPKEEKIWWMKMLVEGTKIKDKANNDIEMAGGAVYAKKPSGVRNNEVLLMLSSPNAGMYRPAAWSHPQFRPIMTDASNNYYWVVSMGQTYSFHEQYDWQYYDDFREYYAAIVENRY